MIRRLFARLAAAAGEITDQELVAVSGLGMLGVGLASVWMPLGLIVPGALLVVIALGFSFDGLFNALGRR